MKISEMNTDRLAAVLCEIAEPVDHIVNNKNFIAALKKYSEADKGKMTKAGANMRLYALLLPVLLGELKQDTYTVIAALNDKKAEDIAAQSAEETLADVKAAFDSDIIGFFR